MSSGYPRDSENVQGSTPDHRHPPPSHSDSTSPDDESLREENTLSACLLRILQSDQPGVCGKDSSSDDHPLESSLNGSSNNGTGHCRNQKNSKLFDQLDCRRLYLPHCQRSSRGSSCTTKTSPEMSSSYTAEDTEETNGESGDKMKSWRAAGEALRKVLVETGAVPVSGANERKLIKAGCLKRGLRKKAEGSGSGEGSPASDDPMNMMLEEYQAKEVTENDDTTEQSPTKPLLSNVESVITNSQKTEDKATAQRSQGLINVRERVQQITSRLGHMKSTPGDIGGKKSHLHKYNRTTGPLQTRSSSIGHGSSSESEEENEVKRHKVFVPRCRRVSSSSKSPKTAQDSTTSGTPNTCQNCSEKLQEEDKDICPKCQEKISLTEEAGGQDRLSDMDNQEDMVTEKFQKLARNQENNSLISDSDDASLSYYRNYDRSCCSGRLMSAETDSITNLADVESSLHSDENETLEESDLNDKRWSDKYGFHFEKDKVTENGEEEEERSSSKYHGWGSDEDNECWSEQGTLKRNKEKKAQAEGEAETEEKDLCENIDDIPDLVFDESSSGHENDRGRVNTDGLPALVTDSSGASASDGDAEADDEFECDCAVCQQHRTREASASGNGWLTEEEEQILGALDSDRIEYLTSNSTHHPQVISPAELTPLDLLLMREGRRELLELMFQNVIMQMLTVYPDLLSDQAPPPAEATTINDLPKVRVDSSHISDDFVCPICLCRFEIGEEVRDLPCHHTFHGLCIQAWLSKSGTCPVCRFVISSAS